MLTAGEKKLLREAICAGAFSELMQVPDASTGRPAFSRKPITADLLEAVSLKSDDEIKATLTLYTVNKTRQLQTTKDRLIAQLANVNAEIGL